MKERRRVLRLCFKTRLNLYALIFEHDHPVFHAFGWHAVADGINHAVKFADDLAKPRLILRAVPAFSHTKRVHVLRILLTEHAKELVIHEMVLETVHHASFEYVAPDRALVLARAFVSRRGAAEMLLADLHKPAAAAATLDQA